MAGDSNVVLRWEIDNAAARLATGRVESGVFEEGGFIWTAVVERRAQSPKNLAHVMLRCGVDHNGPWECEGKVDVHLMRLNGAASLHFVIKSDISVSDKNCDWKCGESGLWWETMAHLTYCHSDKTTLEFHINIISSERGGPIADPAKFAAPNDMSNVILKIGDEKLHVSKEFLSIHSPVFKALFFGNFAEKEKEEVEIKDVVYEEFVDLLHVIYPGNVKTRDATVLHILALGDRFQMERVIDLAQSHLQASKKYTAAEKLKLADKYRLAELRDNCLKAYSSVREISSLESTPEYSNFSDSMKAAVCDRVMKLAKSIN